MAVRVLAHFVPGEKVLKFLAQHHDWLDVRFCAEDDDGNAGSTPASPSATRSHDGLPSVSPAGADVAIIGGGIVGTALAAELAGRGARVTVMSPVLAPSLYQPTILASASLGTI